MKNAMLLLTFFSVYRMFCDEESLPENSGDASLYITETFDSVRNYVTYCDENNIELTPTGIITTVMKSLQESNEYCQFSVDEFSACNDFVSAVIKAYNN